MRLRPVRNRFLLNLIRVVALVGLVAAAGALAGVAVGVPLGRLDFAGSSAIRLDQSRLAGSIDPTAAIAISTDLPLGWKEGDEALAAFGILDNEFCGETIDLPAKLSPVESSVFVDESGGSTIISQAVRVEQWQSAKEYIRSIDRIVSDCDKFFQPGADGKRVRIDIKDGQGQAPITDFVSRTYVASVGDSVQTWSVMAVGDVVIGLRHLGESAPQHSFMPNLQNRILMRIAPQTFSPATGDTRSRDEADGQSTTGTETTLIEGGAADETPTVPDGSTPDATAPDATAPDATAPAEPDRTTPVTQDESPPEEPRD